MYICFQKFKWPKNSWKRKQIFAVCAYKSAHWSSNYKSYYCIYILSLFFHEYPLIRPLKFSFKYHDMVKDGLETLKVIYRMCPIYAPLKVRCIHQSYIITSSWDEKIVFVQSHQRLTGPWALDRKYRKVTEFIGVYFVGQPSQWYESDKQTTLAIFSSFIDIVNNRVLFRVQLSRYGNSRVVEE